MSAPAIAHPATLELSTVDADDIYGTGTVTVTVNADPIDPDIVILALESGGTIRATLDRSATTKLAHALGWHAHRPAPPAPVAGTGGQRAAQVAANTAAHRWTDRETTLVDSAISNVARAGRHFSADDVYAALPDGFPVTKGMSARLRSAAHRGLIQPTDRHVTSARGGEHDHGQRLTVWTSTVFRG